LAFLRFSGALLTYLTPYGLTLPLDRQAKNPVSPKPALSPSERKKRLVPTRFASNTPPGVVAASFAGI
jgi:hypothetical protein